MKFVVKLVSALVLGLFTAPPFAEAQQTGRVWRIGYLSPGSGPFESFRGALQKLGYVEGENIVLESRIAETGDRLSALADELARLPVDVIVTRDTTAALAAQRATSTIPIVMVIGSAPVPLGLVKSLSRPGANITGVTGLEAGLSAKRVELLKQVAPGISTLTVVWNKNSPYGVAAFKQTQAAARSFGLDVHSLEVNESGPQGFSLDTSDKPLTHGLFVITDSVTWSHGTRIVELASKWRLPAIYDFKEYVELGGLMSYGTVFASLWERAAYLVDKVLRGAKPADLPVEQATTFELVLNLRTAKLLGMSVPEPILLRSDHVIR